MSLKNKSVLQSPYIYVSPSTKTVLSVMICLLLPQVAMLFLTRSYSSLFVILAAVLASLLAEALYGIKKRPSVVTVLVALLQGLLVGFLLPATYPPVAVFIICFCAMALGKYAFEGFAASWINPVALAVAAAYFIYACPFPSFGGDFSLFREKNAALSMIRDGQFALAPMDSIVTDFLNRNVFRRFGMEIPDGYVSLFWDSGSPIPAFRFNLLNLLASLILFSGDMQGLLVPFSFCLSYGLLVRFIPISYVAGTQLYGDIFLAFLTSGVLFSTLFVLQWFGTTPFTAWGKLLYGLCAGIFSFVILGYGNSSVGYVFVVLVMNFISIFIQGFEMRKMKSFYKKTIRPRLEALKEVQSV